MLEDAVVLMKGEQMTNTAEQKLREDIAAAEEILSQTVAQTIRLEPSDPYPA
jgi:hypothetical protein